MSQIAAGELETAVEMARALRARQVSAVELVQRSLSRLEAREPVLNAFSQVWAEEALAEARRIDEAPPDGLPFAGVPLAVKDLYDVAGRETTGCCAAYRGNVAAQDAPTIAAVRRAGLVLIGKTNQHELAAGGTNAVSACGPAHNPWDPQRVTGGSSGGSGAAVAAGIVPWALGSDTGGSIRIPAGMCGTFGLKPTTGQLPTAGMLPLAPSLDCPGPMASSVEDTWALYEILAGNPGRGSEERSRPWRVGVLGGYFVHNVHSDIVAGVQQVAATLGDAGVEVEAVDGEGIDDARQVWMRITYAEFAAAHPTLWREHRDQVAPSVLDWMDRGVRFTAEERATAARRREEIGQWFRTRLQSCDALLVPSLPYWAPRLGQEEIDLGANGVVTLGQVGAGWHTCTLNLVGLPAINLPAGRSPDGLPFGVSLVGRDDDEDSILRLAALWVQASAYQLSLSRG
jgi:aspartyl-tRNA(Asn)/glutamyl-tRNA(Gln) amidotransferase subunit A